MENTKLCLRCNTIKPFSDFWKDKTKKHNLCCSCISCKNKYQQQLVLTTEDRFKRCCYLRKFREKNRKKYRKENRLRSRLYHRSEKGKHYDKTYRQEHRLEANAQSAVNRAIKAGKLKPAKEIKCYCGENAEHYHHYLGYAKENYFKIIAVCAPCHGKLHFYFSKKVLNFYCN